MSSQSNLSPTDYKMLERAIEISRLGLSNVAPNPHVGAVIAVGDLIIGEGFHRKWGGPHAEVNAFNSVSEANSKLLDRATIYVTLEPCSHYGKTPPCSLLIINKGVKRVVVGAVDPNPKVDGGGIEMMQRAGIEVVIADEEIARRCRELDPVFMTSFTFKRPFVTLKWAQSNDGFMADKEGHPVKFSTPPTSTLVHQLRSCHQAILTTSTTVLADNPRLDSRLWSGGQSPVKFILDRNGKTSPNANIFTTGSEPIILTASSPAEILQQLYSRNINSVLVEAGPTLLNEFIKSGLWDRIRIERAPFNLGENGGKPAPVPPALPYDVETIDGREIFYIKNRN
ncbi:MAG: bifunctional diaminohydroxyphosphoribosylaminopyrimidine deaminase/5-amino-6-(5-phosphoribosylamino)uracil reductase RibD [Muribaculaceae bacterium]|nr:bifunctional diaminohydroxyphosphoribosylaminopyrimidine deaminase/5-amino-6-(5-phosphoribosylamino)uracil reductase RibD [Muribaculaceae bacterium]